MASAEDRANIRKEAISPLYLLRMNSLPFISYVYCWHFLNPTQPLTNGVIFYVISAKEVSPTIVFIRLKMEMKRGILSHENKKLPHKVSSVSTADTEYYETIKT